MYCKANKHGTPDGYDKGTPTGSLTVGHMYVCRPMLTGRIAKYTLSRSHWEQEGCATLCNAMGCGTSGGSE